MTSIIPWGPLLTRAAASSPPTPDRPSDSDDELEQKQTRIPPTSFPGIRLIRIAVLLGCVAERGCAFPSPIGKGKARRRYVKAGGRKSQGRSAGGTGRLEDSSANETVHIDRIQAFGDGD